MDKIEAVSYHNNVMLCTVPGTSLTHVTHEEKCSVHVSLRKLRENRITLDIIDLFDSTIIGSEMSL